MLGTPREKKYSLLTLIVVSTVCMDISSVVDVVNLILTMGIALQLICPKC